MSTTVDLGIDLGTTNSAIAVFESGHAEVLKDVEMASDTLPSCVWFDSQSVHVGTIARNALLRPVDDQNAVEGFKRFMGRDVSWSISSLDSAVTPELLSSHILRELRGWATVRLGEQPAEAVITIPAAFGETEKSAVMAASELAGFSRATLIQEPVAAGLAYGWGREDTSKPFLVYDFGGGTFDASLIRAVSGQLVVLGNHGNHTEGGRDMDAAILDQLVRPKLAGRLASDDWNLRKAKVACEDAKKRLSFPNRDTTVVSLAAANVMLDDGTFASEPVTIFRTDVEDLVLAQIERTVEVVRELLDDQKLRDIDLAAIILVGGPTLMPVVRRVLQETFRAPLFTRIDPMTVVAQGAALFAASIQKTSQPVATRQAGVRTLRLEYDPVADMPLVPVGITGQGSPLPEGSTLRLRRQDGLWDSGLVRVSGGSIALSVALSDDRTSDFGIELFDASGLMVEVQPWQFTVTRGIAAAAPPLSRAIGVAASDALSDDKVNVHILAKRGQPTPLTARSKYALRHALQPGLDAEVLRVGFFEGPATTGEEFAPERCRRIGEVVVKGSHIDRPVPAGSDVEVSIRIDASKNAVGRVYFPMLQRTIEGELLEMAREALPDHSDLEARLESVKRKIAALENADVSVSSLRDKQDAAEQAVVSAMTKNRDDIARAEARVEQLELAVDGLEKSEAPRLALEELEGALSFAEEIVEAYGGPREKRRLDTLAEEAAKAREKNDASDAKVVEDKLFALGVQLYWAQPGAWVNKFQSLASTGSFIDGSRANDLIRRGRQALDSGDSELLRRVVIDLSDLIPTEQRDDKWAIYSGIVRRG